MEPRHSTPALKRCFDIMVTGILLICLSPLFIVVSILIRLESKGPIFYYSYRVGQGYRVFRFYKFRSMRANADQLVDQLKHLNQYGKEHKGPKGSQLKRSDLIKPRDLNMLVSDDTVYPVEAYEQYQSRSDENSFVKFKDDPRITRVGKFIRNTSIDELPQLFNILKGDMSLVGNRPLPLYEAEKLTKDDTVGRFLAPAGLTGLWQVTERGKDHMTPEGRCKLDIEYAQHHNFWMDMRILLKTPLAAFQHENV
ncbi:MAG: sugar transferase [Roseivirga sp.]|nr:sugar transferase [Roseivirga sp.]